MLTERVEDANRNGEGCFQRDDGDYQGTSEGAREASSDEFSVARLSAFPKAAIIKLT